MRYTDLKSLLEGSRSSRKYFLSLPSKIQYKLHGYNSSIHSLEQLHSLSDSLLKADAADKLGKWN